MRKKIIACLAVGALLATMIPSLAFAAVKPEVNQAQTEVISEGEVVATVYYGSAEYGKVNVIVTGKVGAIQPIGNNTDGWDYYKDNVYNQWNKVYDMNADETVTFADASSFSNTDNAFTKTQDVHIKFYKFDEEKPVIDPENTVPAVTVVEAGEEYAVPSLPVTDDITADFTTDEYTLYYSDTNEDGTWKNAEEIDTNKEGYYNLWYSATDDSGKVADGVRKSVHIVDTTAPEVAEIEAKSIDRGDRIDVAALTEEVKAAATDISGIKEVTLSSIDYTPAGEGAETVNVNIKEVTDTFEVDMAGTYALNFTVTDNAKAPNATEATVTITTEEITGNVGFVLSYVDKDGNEVGEQTVVKKDNAVLEYAYDDQGKKTLFYDFVYENDGYLLNVPAGYTVADENDFNDVYDVMRVFVDENGGTNNAEIYAITVTAIEEDAPVTDPDKDAPADTDKGATDGDKTADEELTPPPVPETGDDMNMGLMAGLLALMAVTGTGAAIAGRKVFNK